MKNPISSIRKMLTHRAEVDDFRQANAKRRRAFWNDAIRYDSPLKDENGDDQEDRALSDGGIGAEKIRSLGVETNWREEFYRVFNSLNGVEKRVLEAGLLDCRPTFIARNAGVSRETVYRVFKSVRGKFARVYLLLQAGR